MPRSVLVGLLSGSLLIGAMLLGGCQEDGSQRLPAAWEKGMNLTAYQPESFAAISAERSLERLRKTGSAHVAIVPTWYMRDSTSSRIDRAPEKTATDASVVSAAKQARRLGFEVMLKPHVDLLDESFRGEIEPTSRERWFEDYGRMMRGYADLAQRIGARDLVVGTELTTIAVSEPDRFRELISQIRSRFDGSLTYAANWIDEAEQIEFWDALDRIAIDAYMPLRTESAAPSVAELVRAWEPYRERIEALAARHERRVVFAELGYESRSDTAETPFGGAGGPIDEIAQARAYRAAYEAWEDASFFDGIYWWNWSSSDPLGHVPGPGSYGPAGKRAEIVMRELNGVAGNGATPVFGSRRP